MFEPSAGHVGRAPLVPAPPPDGTQTRRQKPQRNQTPLPAAGLRALRYSIFSEVLFTWGYDAIGRLTDEAEQVVYGKPNAPAPYSKHFAFDRNGNRTVEQVNSGYDEVDPDHRQAGAATVAYLYNEDDQLLVEQRDGAGAYETVYGHYDTGGTFHKGYDTNGSLVEQHKGCGGTAMAPCPAVEDDSYGWDLRGRMTSARGRKGDRSNAINFSDRS